MKKKLLVAFIFLCFINIYPDSLDTLSRQANALWEAQEDTKALTLYPSLATRSLPPWMHARVLYNLGTIELSRHEPFQAFLNFQQISPSLLSVPHFGRNLFLNEGIAYLQYAEEFSRSKASFFDEQIICIDSALYAFEQGQKLHCLVMQQEGESIDPCPEDPLITQWIDFAVSRKQIVRQSKSEFSLHVRDKNQKSVEILQSALQQAHRALQASFIGIATQTDEENKTKQLQAIVHTLQQDVMTFGSMFIPAVLKEQRLRFQEMKDPNNSCLQHPWDLVIPLFDEGYRLAESASQELKTNTPSFTNIQAKQEQTIIRWQQALTLLLNPPGSNAVDQSHPVQVNDTFRQLQEMYVEDQSKPEPSIKELHSW